MKELYPIILGALGFTPTLLEKARDALSNDESTNNGSSTTGKWLKFFVYCSLGVTDCFDAVSDLIISIQTILDPASPSDSEDSGGSGRGYALLLFSMAILGRILNGYYSDVVLNNPEAERTFFGLGKTVFLLEDGAFILLLATRNERPGWLEATSTVLTAICGIGYAVTDSYVYYQIVMGPDRVPGFLSHHMNGIGTADVLLDCLGCGRGKCRMALTILLSPTTLFIIFDIYILFSYVIFRGNRGILSGTLLIITLVIYALGCLLSLMFLSNKWKQWEKVAEAVKEENEARQPDLERSNARKRDDNLADKEKIIKELQAKIAELTADDDKDQNALGDIEQSVIGSKDVPVAAAGDESKMIEEESPARIAELAADDKDKNAPDDIEESGAA